jgi:heme/copper-type cytochrome/quinol oxidase subunit 2
MKLHAGARSDFLVLKIDDHTKELVSSAFWHMVTGVAIFVLFLLAAVVIDIFMRLAKHFHLDPAVIETLHQGAVWLVRIDVFGLIIIAAFTMTRLAYGVVRGPRG